jgi:hypothetical protein
MYAGVKESSRHFAGAAYAKIVVPHIGRAGPSLPLRMTGLLELLGTPMRHRFTRRTAGVDAESRNQSTIGCMGALGKFFVICGILLVGIGLLLILGGRMNLPLGRLPGDIVYRGKNTTFYFPIVTSIVLSIVLSLILYIVGRFTR